VHVTKVLSDRSRWILRQARKRKGWSLSRAARLLGTNVGTIGNWERGDCSPRDVYTIRAWAAHLDLGIRVHLSVCLIKRDPRPLAELSNNGKREAAARKKRDKLGRFIVSDAGESGDSPKSLP